MMLSPLARLVTSKAATATSKSVAANRLFVGVTTTRIVSPAAAVVVSDNASTTTSNAFHYFSTEAAKKVIDPRRGGQRQVWKEYLETGKGASALFDDLDLNYSNTISVKEIEYFLQSVNREGVRDDAFELLLKLGQEKELDEIEFRQWLSMAVVTTTTSTDNNDEASLSLKTTDGGINVIQSAIWDQYLSGENPIQNAIDLYKTIDLDKNGTISPDEINFFLNAINRKGINEEEVQELMDMGNDHQLTENEFSIWLAGAANPDGDILSSSRQDGEGCTPQT